MELRSDVGLFLKHLDERRRQAGLRHQGAAAAIGCSRANWSRVIRGKRPVSAAFARKAIACWPDLAVYYAADLAAAGAAIRAGT